MQKNKLILFTSIVFSLLFFGVYAYGVSGVFHQTSEIRPGTFGKNDDPSGSNVYTFPSTIVAKENLKIHNHYFDANDDDWLRIRDKDNGTYKDLAAGNIWGDKTVYGDSFVDVDDHAYFVNADYDSQLNNLYIAGRVYPNSNNLYLRGKDIWGKDTNSVALHTRLVYTMQLGCSHCEGGDLTIGVGYIGDDKKAHDNYVTIEGPPGHNAGLNVYRINVTKLCLGGVCKTSW